MSMTMEESDIYRLFCVCAAQEEVGIEFFQVQLIFKYSHNPSKEPIMSVKVLCNAFDRFTSR